MAVEENKFAIKGRVLAIDEEASGGDSGRSWTRFRITLGNVKQAGKSKDDAGKVSYAVFGSDGQGPDVSVGQVIGQLFRVTGYEYNKDGKPAVGVSLRTIGKAKIIEDAPVAPQAAAPQAAAVAIEEEMPW